MSRVNDPDELEELITQVQDSFFADDLDSAITQARCVLSRTSSLPEMHEMLCVSLEMKEQYLLAIEASYQWIEKYGANLKNLRVLLECNYLLGDVSLLETTIQRLMNYYGDEEAKQEQDPLILSMCESLIAYAAAMAADLGLHVGAAIDVMERCERNSRIDVMLGYTQKCVGDEEEGHALLEGVVERHDDDDGIAATMLAVHTLESGSHKLARAYLKGCINDERFMSIRPLREIRPYVLGEPMTREMAPRKYSSLFIKRRMDMYLDACN